MLYHSDDSATCGGCHVLNTMELCLARTGLTNLLNTTLVTQQNITSMLKYINQVDRYYERSNIMPQQLKKLDKKPYNFNKIDILV